jgi:hypothetical protein
MAATQLDPSVTSGQPRKDPPRVSPRPKRYALVALAVLAGSGAGAALGEIHRNARTPPPPAQPRIRTYETNGFRTFTSTRRIMAAPFTLERLNVTGHGGTAVIEWYAGSWSALANTGTEAVALYLDGGELAATVAGGNGGEYHARAGLLRWIGPLSPGRHVVSVRLVSSTGPVALPLTVARRPVQEGVNVTEHVRE